MYTVAQRLVWITDREVMGAGQRPDIYAIFIGLYLPTKRSARNASPTVDPTQDLCTRYPLLLDNQRQNVGSKVQRTIGNLAYYTLIKVILTVVTFFCGLKILCY